MISTDALSAFGNIPEAAWSSYRAGRAAAARQQYTVAIHFFTDALTYEEAVGLFRARAYERRGECHWLLGDYDAAEGDFWAALEASDDKKQIARARARLGDVADSRGHYDEALALFRHALKEGMEADDLWAIGKAQRGLGIVHRRQGITEQAIYHLTQALAAFRQAGDAHEQARVLTSLGMTRLARGEYQQAIAAHTESLAILEAYEDRWRIVLALNNIGECHQALYDVENALHNHRRALDLAEEYGANIILPDIQRNLGMDLVELGRLEEGLACLEKALEGARELGKREQEALVLYNLAHAHLAHEDLEASAWAVEELSSVAEALNADRFRALAAFARGELLFAQGQTAAAVAELQAAMLDAQTSVDRGVLWRLHAAMGNMVDDEAVATVHTQIAADFIRQTAEPLQDPQLKAAFLNAAPVMAVLAAAGVDLNRL